MASYRLLSADSHVFEPPDLWTNRVEPRLRNRAPRIVPEEDGDWWYCDGHKMVSAASGAQAGRRFEEPGKLTFADRFENVRRGGYIPKEYIEDMDIDDVDGAVLYPTAGLFLYAVRDSEIVTASARTYNDWLAEFCQSYPNRLKGIALLNIDSVQAAVKELERCVKMGLSGALIPVYPPEDRSYDSPEYEPLWAAAQDLEMPLSLHVATIRPGPGQEISPRTFQAPAFLINVDHWVRMSLARIIISGVFDRYPKLRLGSVEHELSWAAHLLERMDYRYTQSAKGDLWYQFKEEMLPSDYFRRNSFLSFQDDALGIRMRDVIGVDTLLWGSDYPHQESTFPRSRQIVEEILAGCTEEEKAKIARENTARIYHFN